MKITVMVHTASPDDFLSGLGLPSYFRVLVHALTLQDFDPKEFELVYVDRHWAKNRYNFRELVGHSFSIKHVPIHPAHRYWYDKGYCYIAAAKNTGLIYADGELVVSCDDAEVFNSPDFLRLYWDWHKKGRYLHAGYCRWDKVATERGLPLYPLRGEQDMNDTRHFTGHTFEHEDGGWLFAGSSYPLEHALHINGYDERIDGTKGLEDCDFGLRLAATGGKFVMDRSCYVHILKHDNACQSVPWEGGDGTSGTIKNLIAVENFGTLQANRELGEHVANKYALTDRRMEIIQRETIRYRGFDPLAPDNKEKLDPWKGTPTFDLIEQRRMR